MFPIAVLASGRGSNLESIIREIDAGNLKAKIVLLITDNPEAKAIDRAKNHNIPYRVINPQDYLKKKDFNQDLIRTLQEFEPELIVLAGYMRLLSEEIIEKFKNKIINIHPSLLPSFPGLAAQQQALDYGVKFSGCTIHFVDGGMDTGPIIAQEVVPVLPKDDLTDLIDRILIKEHLLYPQVIKWFTENRVKIEGRQVFIQGEEEA